jgi:hypothetical protein
MYNMEYTPIVFGLLIASPMTRRGAYSRITGMTGKTMYAAVAGISFDAEARELAANNGMYLIDINEDTERIDVTQPDKVGTW